MRMTRKGADLSRARSESTAAFIPALELLITETMDEWKIPGLAIAVVQNGEVALLRAYGLRARAIPRPRFGAARAGVGLSNPIFS